MSAKRSNRLKSPKTLSRAKEGYRLTPSGWAPTDELRPITALFADIVGSTALGEFLAIEEVKALVGECVSRIAETIERHGGSVGAYMGDGVAAFFGLEGAGEDDPRRAALAALDVRNVVAEYADEARAAWGVENLSVRIGINSGRVATGPVGGRRPQVLALGDAVNVAARLQSIADPGSIVIGSAVAEALTGRFRLESLGLVELKGRVKRLEAFVLMAEAALDQAERSKRPIVGRERELDRLEGVLSDLASGRGQISLILGEAGIGKTRLLEEIRQRAASNILWLGARSSATKERLPYAPFVDALRCWLGLDVGIQDIAIRVRLRARLRELLGGEGDELVPPLVRLLGVRPRTRGDQRLEGLPVEVLRASLHNAYVRWLTALARAVPVVLAIDNFGRVDEATLQLGEELLSVTDRAPLAVIITMRPDSSAQGWAVRVRALSDFAHRTDELRLEALNDEDCASLFAALDESGVVDREVQSTLVRRAEGNPLYIEELFSAVAGDPGGEVTKDAELALPPALEGLLLSRIDRLPNDAKEALQAAAVLGREFSKHVLEHMSMGGDLEAALSILLRADLIRERRHQPAQYAFKHGLLREAALSTLTSTSRRRLHGRAALAIESTCGPDLRENVPALAWHYLIAGDPAKAVDFLEDLGERLTSLYRYEQAIDVLEKCREQLSQRTARQEYRRITQKLAELRARIGDSAGATALVDELRRRVKSADEWARLQAFEAQMRAEAGDLEGAEQLLDECPEQPVEMPVAQKVIALSAQISLRRQDFPRAREQLERLGDVDALAPEVGFDASSLWAGYLAATGDFVTAKSWGKRAVGLAKMIGRAGLEFRAQRQLGVLYLLNGRVRSGHAMLRQAFDQCDQLGFAIGALESGINLVHSAYLLGELDEAELVGRTMMAMTEAPFWKALVLSNLATIKFEKNKLAEAEEFAHQVLSFGIQITSVAPRIAARIALGRVHSARHDWKRADQELLLAEGEVAPLAGRHGLWLSLRTILGEVAWRKGNWEDASEYADSAVEAMPNAEKPLHVGVLRLKGLVEAQRDKPKGRSILEEARGMSRVMEMRLEEARTLVAIASVDAGEADASLKQAASIFSACGCEHGLIEAAEARSLIRNLHSIDRD